jgi:glycosyltransferase involved in cell wall biosynthesis
MRILQIVDSLKYGGAQKLLVTFARQAQEHRVATTIVSLYDSSGAPLRPQLEEWGAQVIVLQGRRLLELRNFRALQTILRAEKFGVVQTHLTHANIIGIWAARLAGLPAFATLHSAGIDHRHDNLLRDELERFSLRRVATRVIAVAQSVSDFHAPILCRPLDVVPNGVEMPPLLSEVERAALRAELTGDTRRLICLAVGRMSLPKGYPDLLTAFDLVRAQCPQALLVIAGDGEMRPQLESQVAALGLQNHVKLLGMRSDVPRLLTVADLYVNASHWEGLPLAHLEAMIAGLPVVVTTVGEAPRLVVDGVGLLVPPHKPEELAQAIQTLLADPARRLQMGRAAQTYVQQHYGAAVWFEKLLDLYQQAGARA